LFYLSWYGYSAAARRIGHIDGGLEANPRLNPSRHFHELVTLTIQHLVVLTFRIEMDDDVILAHRVDEHGV
jgi:hypothetical protein